MKFVTLLENTACREDLTASHGLSLYIETPRHKILFDMGPDESFVRNAEALGVDLSAVDVAMLSHGHWDHGGGLEAFLRVNRTAKIYVRENAFEPHLAAEPEGLKPIGVDDPLNERIIRVGESLRIDEELLLFADVPRDFDTCGSSATLMKDSGAGVELDDFTHEQDLLITAEGKTVLVAGCAHRGIVNILAGAKARLGGLPDHTFGGFHLFQLQAGDSAADQVIDRTAAALLPGNTVYHTGHCTGDYAYERLKAVLGDRLEPIPGGSVCRI